MPFQQMGLSEPLLRNLTKLKFTLPTPIQKQAIPVAILGKDVVGTAQTGTGKTAAFLLPVLNRLLEKPSPRTGALILTPTRELATQIGDVLRGLAAGTPIRSVLVTGGMPDFPQQKALRAGATVVVATPGRMLDHVNRGNANFSQLQTLILDEADQMFDMGFLPDMKRIIASLPKERQTLLFSATMPPEIERLIGSILRNPVKVTVGTVGEAAGLINQTAFPVPMHRKAALLQHLLEQWETPTVLVFTRTKHGAKKLARTLFASGHDVGELHGDRTPNQRERTMRGFRDGKIPLLVATNIAARGLDVRHITHVVNYDLPDVPEEYVHRIGRTGRAGDTGEAISLVSPAENSMLMRIERQIRKRIDRINLADFDYAAAPEPKDRPEQKQRKNSGGGRPNQKLQVVQFDWRKKKPSRGQGGR